MVTIEKQNPGVRIQNSEYKAEAALTDSVFFWLLDSEF
jgi:hypothetical protein